MKRSKFIRRESQAALVEKYRMIGESEPFLDTMEQVSRAAKVNRPVLIIGERGTGKELVAARLHYLSPRWQAPKVAINCAAFSPELLESEIFGYEQGAFTGATRTKPGRFELADGGTLFLDELAQSPMALQEKILRVLEYQEFERVGGVEPIQVDVRVIAATNQDLPHLCQQGKFKEDLLDRLSFEVITLPALRHRLDDLPILVNAFAMRMAREMDQETVPRFSEGVVEQMLNYQWPGNIRELKNVVERAVYTRPAGIIDALIFDPFESPYRPRPIKPGRGIEPGQEKGVEPHQKVKEATNKDLLKSTLPATVEAIERRMATAALEKHQYNQKKASEELGISYYQFRRLLKRHELN